MVINTTSTYVGPSFVRAHLLFVLVAGLVNSRLIIDSKMESPEGFGPLSSFFTSPPFFISGSISFATNLQSWLSAFTILDL